MAAIDLEDVARRTTSRSPYRVPAGHGCDAEPRWSGEADPAMIVATLILFAASLVRLAPPFEGHEAFGAEPTLALGASLGCGWLALREGVLRLRALYAARRNDATARSPTIE